jgi:CRP/FNR family transcriptional regulator
VKNQEWIPLVPSRDRPMPLTSAAPGQGDARYAVCELCRMADLCRPVGPEREARDALARIVRRRRPLRRGEYLFRAGDACHAVSALCAGSAKSCTTNEDGTTQVLGFHFTGELVGLCGLGAQRHLCDAVALETGEVCEIPLARLMEVVEQSPAIRQFVYRLLGEELQHQHLLMQPLVGKAAAAARLAAYLLSLVRRYESRGLPAREIRLSMSRDDIGNYLGLAKETVSRLFGHFENEGLIRVRVRRLQVTDIARLAALAGGSRAPSRA